jgi:DNA-binding MarR family transcriptional regulator
MPYRSSSRPASPDAGGHAPPLALEDFLPYRLNRLAEKVSREFSTIYADRHGLTRPEWRTLATLGQFGTMTATEIGAHSSMHKTKVSRAVSALERRKWLARGMDPIDRRLEHLTLTRAGHAAYRELVPLMQAHEARLLGRMTLSERETIMRAIAELERVLGI